MNAPLNLLPDKIALDGASASGKSTVGKELAHRLGCGFLDTGMMYRAVTLLALQGSIALNDTSGLGDIAERSFFEVARNHNRGWRLIADGEDLTDELNSDLINQHVSPVSAVSEVRRALVRQQRRIAESGQIVMVGRDIGTVVLPDAPLKVYLSASPETRARRRTEDTVGNIDRLDYDEVLRSIKMRDEIDSTREDSPLRPADDAVIIDTDDLTADEVVEAIMELAGASVSSLSDQELVGAKTA